MCSWVESLIILLCVVTDLAISRSPGLPSTQKQDSEIRKNTILRIASVCHVTQKEEPNKRVTHWWFPLVLRTPFYAWIRELSLSNLAEMLTILTESSRGFPDSFRETDNSGMLLWAGQHRLHWKSYLGDTESHVVFILHVTLWNNIRISHIRSNIGDVTTQYNNQSISEKS